MRRPDEVIAVLYVDQDGLVRSGRLLTEDPAGGNRATQLVARGGRSLGPADVLALLAPCLPSEDHRAALTRAAGVGYRVEPV